jgi:nucleotide-binding universal stress UspA family protein
MCPSPAAMTSAATLVETQAFNILVATAGDQESAGAVRAAALLSRRLGGSVEVLTIVTPFPHALPTGLMMASAAEIDEESRKAAIERVRRQLEGVRGSAGWTVHAAVGWPADCIVDASRHWPVSLVVMGIGEHSAMARFFGSETAIATVKRGRTPILAVPAGFARSPVHAFAAIDFTPSSIEAATLAARLVASNGSVTLVHTSIFAGPSHEPGSIMDVYSTGARDRLETIAREISTSTGRRVKTFLANGPVADVLTSLAANSKGDLIAVGSHDRGLIDRMLIGSVRSQILRHAKCAVLVVPQQQMEEAE